MCRGASMNGMRMLKPERPSRLMTITSACPTILKDLVRLKLATRAMTRSPNRPEGIRRTSGCGCPKLGRRARFRDAANGLVHPVGDEHVRLGRQPRVPVGGPDQITAVGRE